MKYFFWAIALVVCGCADNAVTKTGDSPRPAAPKTADQIETERKLQSLVDSMVTKNPLIYPIRDNGKPNTMYGRMPSNWSEEVDQRVWKAFWALVDQGKEAVPVLLANLNRTELSTYVDSVQGPSDHPYDERSVGEMCKHAIIDIFHVGGPGYLFRHNSKGETLTYPDYFGTVFYPPENAAKWWEKNRDKSVEQIREMIRDWQIERETAFGFENEQQKKEILKNLEDGYARPLDRKSPPRLDLPQIIEKIRDVQFDNNMAEEQKNEKIKQIIKSFASPTDSTSQPRD
jgi:hypothetical protein